MPRPTKLTELAVKKLEEAFALGCTDQEACVYANICKQTLYNYQAKNKEFLDRKELLKSTPFLEARMAVIRNFKKDPRLALRFLERRKSDEFNTRQTINSDRKVEITFDSAFKESKKNKKSHQI